MEPSESPPQKKSPKKDKAATFLQPEEVVQEVVQEVTDGPNIGQLDHLDPDHDLSLDHDVDHDDANLGTEHDEEAEVEVGPEIVLPAPLPTRLRPGTPSPSRTASPHVKQKIRQMSMSDTENDVDWTKHMHPIMGSKSAPVPHRDHTHGPHHHHARHHKDKHQSGSSPHRHSHFHRHQNNDHVQFDEPEQSVNLLHQNPAAAGVMEVPSTSSSPAPSLPRPHHHHHQHQQNHRNDDDAGAKNGVKIQLAVVKGDVFVPTRTRARPPANSFIETSELGPPGAGRRWLIDMKGFREDEITFTLEGVNLKVEGKQTTRPGKMTHYSEVISIPINYNIEALKVYRNKAIGTLVLAYLPDNLSDNVK